MGSWGVPALASDAGLDVVDFLEEHYDGQDDLVLSEVLEQLVAEGFLTNDRSNIDFYFDSSAMVLAELIVMFNEHGKFVIPGDGVSADLENKRSFKFDNESLEFVLNRLLDIQQEVPDEDREREYTVLKRESKTSDQWHPHLSSLIAKITSIRS